jgi:hypothetical protein
MFILAHIGIGRTITRPWSARLPVVPFVVGALLPDVIDKPLFYAHLFSGITATRTIAHTGLFAAAVGAIALFTRSRAWMAVALGVASHLLLDCLMDTMSHDPHSAIVALGWPFLYRRFASFPFRSPVEHLQRLWNLPVLLTETLGLVLIAWEFLARQRREIVQDARRAITTRGTTDI